jgi:hypothetical protein
LVNFNSIWKSLTTTNTPNSNKRRNNAMGANGATKPAVLFTKAEGTFSWEIAGETVHVNSVGSGWRQMRVDRPINRNPNVQTKLVLGNLRPVKHGGNANGDFQHLIVGVAPAAITELSGHAGTFRNGLSWNAQNAHLTIGNCSVVSGLPQPSPLDKLVMTFLNDVCSLEVVSEDAPEPLIAGHTVPSAKIALAKFPKTGPELFFCFAVHDVGFGFDILSLQETTVV